MPSKRHPKGQPNDARGSTRGVLFIYRPGRENPYGVQWPEYVFDPVTNARKRRRRSLYFPTAESRETKAKELREARRSRMLVSSVSRAEIDEFRAFKSVVGDAPWQNIVAGWRAHQLATGILECMTTVEAAAKTYLERAEKLLARDKLSKGHVRHMRHKIELFVEQFGDMMLDKVTRAQIEDWIDDFDDIESEFTFDNYVKHISAFFSYFVDERVIAENPATRIERRSDGVGEVGIISVAQTAQLFHTCMTVERFKPLIGRLAMEAFAGLRFGSGCRLEKADINVEDKGVLLPKKKLKTKRRHYIDGLPENIWSWIAINPDGCWDVTPRQYMGLKSELFVVAKVPHPNNCLRHNFATYHVAAEKNPGLTAYLLCHRNQDQLYEHYKGRAKDTAGKLYQTITPQTAKQLSVGFEPVKPPAEAGRVGRPRVQE